MMTLTARATSPVGPVRMAATERGGMWETVPVSEPSPGWVELDDNGWGALIGWVAGAENLRRSPVDDRARTVTGTRTYPDGSVEEFNVPFTAEDRAIVDESANSYLADAGVEERPGGFRWFLWLPEQFSSWKDFSSTVTRAVYAVDPKPVHPADIRSAMERVLRPLYDGRA